MKKNTKYKSNEKKQLFLISGDYTLMKIICNFCHILQIDPPKSCTLDIYIIPINQIREFPFKYQFLKKSCIDNSLSQYSIFNNYQVYVNKRINKQIFSYMFKFMAVKLFNSLIVSSLVYFLLIFAIHFLFSEPFSYIYVRRHSKLLPGQSVQMI